MYKDSDLVAKATKSMDDLLRQIERLPEARRRMKDPAYDSNQKGQYLDLLMQAIVDLSKLNTPEQLHSINEAFASLNLESYKGLMRRNQTGEDFERQNKVEQFMRVVIQLEANLPEIYLTIRKSSQNPIVKVEALMKERYGNHFKYEGVMKDPYRINIEAAERIMNERKFTPEETYHQHGFPQRGRMNRIEGHIFLDKEKGWYEERLCVDNEVTKFFLYRFYENEAARKDVMASHISEESAFEYVLSHGLKGWDKNHLSRFFSDYLVKGVEKDLEKIKPDSDELIRRGKVIQTLRNYVVVNDRGSKKGFEVKHLDDLKSQPHRTKVFIGTKRDCQLYADAPDEEARGRVEDLAADRHRKRVPLPSEAKASTVKDQVEGVMEKLKLKALGIQASLFGAREEQGKTKNKGF